MKKKTRELLLGALMLGIGALYLALTLGIPRKGGIDASFVPFVLSAIILLLGTLQTVGALRIKNEGANGQEKTESKEKVDTPTVLKTIFLILVYVAFLNKIGFVIMSILYLFIQFIVLTPAYKKKNYLMYAIVAIVSSVSIFLIFRYIFDLMLPAGLLQ
ncbi:MAG: tripartite tricarboxylate transporter TctB family protein [Spirochaetales bacterium]|jgi:putative tricarboxylic transport membrane protein